MADVKGKADEKLAELGRATSLADIDIDEAHRDAIAWVKRHPKNFEALGRHDEST